MEKDLHLKRLLKGPPTILLQNSQGDLTSKSVSNGRIDSPNMDKYTAGIELSNACRNYYAKRLRAAEGVKKKLGLTMTDAKEVESEENNSEDEGYTTQKHAPKKCNKIDRAMDRLKKELASLIDQDLMLMKQLLTLNEQIEELKWQRKFSGYASDVSKDSSIDGTSSTYLVTSGYGLASDSDYEQTSHTSHDILPGKYPTPSMLSMLSTNSLACSRNWDCSRSLEWIRAPNKADCTDQDTDISTSDLGSSTEITNSSGSLKRHSHGGKTDTLNSTITNSSQGTEHDVSTEVEDIEHDTTVKYTSKDTDVNKNSIDSSSDNNTLSRTGGNNENDDISCIDALKAFDMVLDGIGDSDSESCDLDVQVHVEPHYMSRFDFGPVPADIDVNEDFHNDLDICIPAPNYGESASESDAESMGSQVIKNLVITEQKNAKAGEEIF